MPANDLFKLKAAAFVTIRSEADGGSPSIRQPLLLFFYPA
jgi:hypothetical protein